MLIIQLLQLGLRKMDTRTVIKCRKVFRTDNSFFPREIIYPVDNYILEDIVKWYKENIMYYEKRDSLERKSIALISEELFKMFLVANVSSKDNNENDSNLTVEINNECVYFSGTKGKSIYPDVFESKKFDYIWKKNKFEEFNFLELYKLEKRNRRVSIVFNSVYLNYKSKARNKKYFQKDNYKYSEKEIVIIEALKIFSTSYEISNYTNIPQRTVRYYLNKMENFGLIMSDDKLNSPNRRYMLRDNSAS